MKYGLRKACAGCPFLKNDGNHPEAVRLTAGRIEEIHETVTNWHGGQFPCHKTVNYKKRDRDKEQHCAGAIAYAGKINGDGAQVTKYVVYAVEKLTYEDYGPPEVVFDSLEDWLETAIERPLRHVHYIDVGKYGQGEEDED